MRFKPLLFLLFFVLFSISYAWYGGETRGFFFTKCDKIEVDIFGVENYGEWDADPYCVETSPGHFECNCSDNFMLYLTPAPNAVGSYNITITNYYEEKVRTITKTVTIEVPYENKTKIEELNKTLEDLQERFDAMQEFYQKVIMNYRSKVKGLEEHIDYLNSLLNTTSRDLKTLQDRVKEIVNENNALRNENSRLRQMYEGAKRESRLYLYSAVGSGAGLILAVLGLLIKK